MEPLKEKLPKEISDFFEKTFEQISISEYDTVDISEWDIVADDKSIHLKGTLIVLKDYLYKTYGKLIKSKKYEVSIKCQEVSTEYQLADKYLLEKITIEGTLGKSSVQLLWNHVPNNKSHAYNLYPYGSNEELNILIPEARKILNTILEKWLLYEHNRSNKTIKTKDWYLNENSS